MKSTILFITVLLVFLAGLACAETIWDGPLDPGEFEKWEFVKTTSVSPMHISIILQNPDKQAPVQRVKLLINRFTEVILRYKYFLSGEIYLYHLDLNRNRYVRQEITQQDRVRCMRCHADRLKKPNSARLRIAY